MDREELLLNIESRYEGDGIDDANDRFEEMEDRLNNLEDAGTAAESGADRAGGGFSRLMPMIGGVIAAAGVLTAVLGTLGAGLGAVLDWDQSMRTFAAQTGVTREELEDYRDIAQEIFTNNWGDSIDDVTTSMAATRNITQATGDELQKLTQDALIYREVFGADVTESVRAADNMMQQFGISGDRAFDLLTRGAQLTGDPMGDLLDTINEYSGNFAQLGFSADQAMNVVVQAMNAGAFSTDAVADSIREFGIRLQDGTSNAAILKLGSDAQQVLSDFENGFAGGEEVFQTVIDSLNAIEDPLERNRLGVEIFGTKWEDLGEEAILAMDLTTDALGDVADATENAGDLVGGGLVNAWNQMKRTGMTLLADFLTPYVEAFAEDAIPLMQQFGEWLQTEGVVYLQEFGTAIGQAVSFIVLIGSAIIDRLGGMDAILSTLADAATLVGTAIQLVVGAIGSLSPESITLIGVALAVMAAPAVIAGIGAVATAIMGLAASAGATMVAFAPLIFILAIVAAYETNFGGLRDSVVAFREAVADGDTVGAVQALASALGAIPMGISQELFDIAGIEWTVSEGLSAWGDVFSMAGRIIDALVNEKIPALLEPIPMPGWVTELQTKLSALLINATLLPGRIRDFISNITNVVIPEWITNFQNGMNTVRNIWTELPTLINTGMTTLAALVLPQWLTDFVNQSGLIRWWFGTGEGSIPALATAAFEALKTLVVPEVFSTLKTAIEDPKLILEAIPDAFQAFKDAINNFTVPTWIDDLIGRLESMFNKISSAVGLLSAGIDGAASFLGIGNATGGYFDGFTVVGERGPEVIYGSGRVVPNHGLNGFANNMPAAATAGAGGEVVIPISLELDGRKVYETVVRHGNRRAQ